ncbi:hypothetical protein HER10_EVM0004002 [Colletotrichum scovillei]|uniref:Cbr-clec-223 protein n=1 Tax=Colletotrichum scovillei TaxID=1209932 RepID=A0A9P7QQV3_9PEZI|nr:uncharacterized protein HER10_EVM0004002 [Colletotrichum scovillei]KAF4773740.1 hypothetical protein HER10_EVM0004002 [Colletotrichum scovillei]KAG7040883.1 cbr-clec-223 protein [Colletotrichum scovillei]KAG7060927.1 cbr-clec-223 protein [Colletotrichum scovillei]
MASNIHGGSGSSQDQRFSMNNGHDGRATMANSMPTKPSSHYYPNGIPDGYKMVGTKEGETPRLYIEDNLPIAFYNQPTKEIKAIFSTNNGEFPTRGLSHVLPARQIDLWSAEELQERANAIRKKYWSHMKSMPQLEFWEDLYDYFDCYDIYFQGAMNLWNLMLHLYHENQCLVRNLHQEIVAEVGHWCDEWAAKSENKKKLLDFKDFQGDVLNLLSSEDRVDLQGLPPVSMELVRNALRFRHDQLLGKPWAQPTSYPQNSLGYQWEEGTLQHWLAGQPVQDTPSGLAPASTAPNLTKGNPDSPLSQTSPAAKASPPKPLIVSGTYRHIPIDHLHHDVATAVNRVSYPEGTSADNRQTLSTSHGHGNDDSRQLPGHLLPNVAQTNQTSISRGGNAGPGGSAFYPHAIRHDGHPFNTPFTTGPHGMPQPYLGPVSSPHAPSHGPPQGHPQGHSQGHSYGTSRGPPHGPPHGPMEPPAGPGNRRYGQPSQVIPSPQRPNDNRFNNAGHSAHITGSVPVGGAQRAQSAAFPGVAPEPVSFQRNNGKRNASIDPHFGQAGDRGSQMGHPRFETRFNSRAVPNSSGPSHHQQRPRGDSKGWEKVHNADDSIHGPVFRRSPTKENRARALSRSSASRQTFTCTNQHEKLGDNKWAYAPCECPSCEARERSVFVQLTSHLARDDLSEKVHAVMSRWGEVEKVNRLALKDQKDYPNFFVRFKDGSRITEIACAKDVECPELHCMLQTRPIHHTRYGSLMYSKASRDANEQHRIPNSYEGSQQPRASSQAPFNQSQSLSARMDSRSQAVSLEQYIIPRPPKSQGKAVHGSQSEAVPETTVPLPTADQATLLQGKTELPKDVKPTQAKTTVDLALQQSSEAESQSKPPSEEVIPDEEKPTKHDSPRISNSPCKVIVVNLPATPQKLTKTSMDTEVHGESDSSGKAVFTPDDSESVASPVKKSSPASISNKENKFGAISDQGPSEECAKVVPHVSPVLEEGSTAPEPIAQSPTYGKGKYRKIFSHRDTSSVEVFDVVPHMPGRSSSSFLKTSFPDEDGPSDSLRLKSGHALDSLIDAGFFIGGPMTTMTDDASKKKNKKNKKKKKKPASGSQDESLPIGDASTVAADDKTLHIPAKTQTGASETADIITKAKDIVATEASPGKSSLPEPPNKGFRANAGGSLRMPKNRNKQPTQLNIAVREGSASGAATLLKEAHAFDGGLPSAASTSQMSFTTAQESCSGNSSPKALSTPATPSSARTPEPKVSPERSVVESEATAKSTLQLNPKAKEFVSPVPRPAVHRVKLAPIPLVPIPVKTTQHQRNFSRSSSVTSRTLTPGPTPPKAKAEKCQGNDAGDGVDNGESSTTGEAPAQDEGTQKSTPESMAKAKQDHPAEGDTPVPQPSNVSSGKGQRQRAKKAASKKKQQQLSSDREQYGQQQQGKQEPQKNNPSPKKQNVQGHKHIQQPQHAPGTHNRKLSVASKDDFPSLPPAPLPASSLPATSVWGKARATSTATKIGTTTTTSSMSSENKTKDKTSLGALPQEGSGKH